MKLAIVDSDSASADVLSFAAQRRGHQAVTLASLMELTGNLPFEPHVIFLGTDLVRDPSLISRVRKALPDVGLFVALERPREPLPSEMLKAGANEVIRAPYNPIEALLRAENWLGNRRPANATDDTMRMADLEIALDRYTATKNGVRLNLTKLELRLLYCLCEHSPYLTPTERLLTFGWDTLGDPDAALIKTHISHIRKKMREAGGTPIDIVSRQTLGYTLTVES
jgi:DNA-binding response OmpR family regulator